MNVRHTTAQLHSPNVKQHHTRWLGFVLKVVLAVLLLTALSVGPTAITLAYNEAEPCSDQLGTDPLPPGMMARVIIHAEPVITGAEILLADIACIEGDPELTHKLTGLSVGAAPLVGAAREFNTATLNLRMRQGGIDDRMVEIVAPASFVVRRDAVVIPGHDLEELVRDVIVSTLPQGSQLSLTFQPVADIPVPAGDVEVRVARMPQRLAGPVSIGVDVYAQGKVWKSLTLRAEARLVQPVWVATQTILKGEPLGPHNTEMRYVQMNGTIQPADLSVDMPLRSNRIIQSDSIVETRFVERIPDAPVGQSVVVTLVAPGMQLQARGTLLADSMIGEIVTVRNVDSGLTFSGRLVSDERVVVEMP